MSETYMVTCKSQNIFVYLSGVLLIEEKINSLCTVSDLILSVLNFCLLLVLIKLQFRHSSEKAIYFAQDVLESC